MSVGVELGRDLEPLRNIGFKERVVKGMMGMGLGERRSFLGISWGLTDTVLSVGQTEIRDTALTTEERVALQGRGTGVQHFAYMTVSAGACTVLGSGVLGAQELWEGPREAAPEIREEWRQKESFY